MNIFKKEQGVWIAGAIGLLTVGLLGCANTQRSQPASDIGALDGASPRAGSVPAAPPQSRRAAPRLDIQSVRVISKNKNTYEAWPTVARTRDGELLVVYSGGREGHVCPFGRIEMMRSEDSGKTWSSPKVLIDTPLDDRDAGVLETAKGTWLVTWFTSDIWVEYFDKALASGSNPEVWTPAKVSRWKKAKANMVPENCPYPEIKKFMEASAQNPGHPASHQWMIRSEDRGATWSEPYPVPLMSPHGPILATDGRLLLAGKDGSTIAVAESLDDGRSWKIIGKIPPAPGDRLGEYHELHMVEAADGRLVAQIRNHNSQHHYETLQSESHDGGKTWTPAHSIGVWGFPSHLLRLSDGRLMMTYSYRGDLHTPKEPNRILVRISEDAGESWSGAAVVAGDFPHLDFGYPSSVELGNGSFLTIWYQHTPPGKPEFWMNRHAQLIQATFTLK